MLKTEEIKIKILIFSILLSTTLQANAFIKDWIESTANKLVGLDRSIVTISDIKYSNPVFPDFDLDYTSTRVTGRALNTSNAETIKTIVFKYEMLECNSSGQSCTTIGEDEERWHTNIPPNQVRYFDHTIKYTYSTSSKITHFRQNIKHVYPYSDM